MSRVTKPFRHSRGPAKGAIQAKFEFEPGFTKSEKAKQGWKIFQNIINSNLSTKWLQDSNEVIISFDVRKLEKARGATEKHLEFGEHKLQMSGMVDRTADWGNGWQVVKVSDLKNRRVLIDVVLEPEFIRNNPPYVIARTLAHEVGTHIVPYIEIFGRASTNEGLTAEDVELLEINAVGKGSGDHRAIRDRSHSHYETFVRQIAPNLSAAEAREFVFSYLVDISRYDAKGMTMSDADTINANILRNLDAIGWAQDYVPKERVNQGIHPLAIQSNQSVFTVRNMASAAVVVAVAAATIYFRQQLMAYAGQFL